MITEEEKAWLEKAYSKDITYLGVKKKLRDSKFPEDKIKELLAEYKIFLDKLQVEEEKDIEEENQFEQKVKGYLNGEKMSFMDKVRVRKFLKNVKKSMQMMDISLDSFRKEVKTIKERFKGKQEMIEKELNDLKIEVIDRLMDCKGQINIENPTTGEQATEEGLMECSLEELFDIFEDSVKELNSIVNGKV